MEKGSKETNEEEETYQSDGFEESKSARLPIAVGVWLIGDRFNHYNDQVDLFFYFFLSNRCKLLIFTSKIPAHI